mmetsp:Transcript_25566/g.56368  ORF Transcript_25566/g.56368 Transcript_25566/m.56368 type:complete len:80 (-) Transcript_25566:146-385(-)
MGVPTNSDSLLLMDKVDVNGANTHPVYTFLKGAVSDSSDIRWNFASYWLVDTMGNIQRLEGGRSSPATFAQKIEQALQA